MCQHLSLANPHYLSFLKPNYSWPVIYLVVFVSSLTRGITHFFMDTQNTTERVEEKNKQTNTDLGQLQAQEGGSLCDTFVQLSVHLQAIAGEYLHETCTKPLGILTHLLTVFSALLPSSHCRLRPSLDSYLKPTVPFCPPLSTASLCLLWGLPSLLHFWSHAQALCVGFVPKQKKRSSEWHQHKRKWMLPIISLLFSFISHSKY